MELLFTKGTTYIFDTAYGAEHSIIKIDETHYINAYYNGKGITTILKLTGNTISKENSFEFYNPILIWLDEYVATPVEKTVIKVNLEIFNTSSSKYILEIFKKMKALHVEKKDIVVEWYYDEDDEEMMETGEDYEDVTGLPFKILQIEE